MTGDHSVNLVTSHNQFCILQTVLHSIDRHFTDWSVKDIDLNFLKFLKSNSDVIIDNCAKCCEVTISYISRNELFGRCRTLQTHD